MTAPLVVLYVEDDADIRELAAGALEDEGFELHAFASGGAALAAAPSLRPHLLLIDVMMPGLDGPATARALRAMPHLAAVPLAFMTAKVRPEERAAYDALGAVGLIPKPFDPMTLAGELRRLAGSARKVPPPPSTPSGVFRVEVDALARQFAEALPERLAQMRRALAEARSSAPGPMPYDFRLRRLAHNLAGAAGTFGFPELGRKARELELLLSRSGTELPLPEPGEQAVEALLREIDDLAARGRGPHAPLVAVGLGRPSQPPDPALVYVLEDDPHVAEEIDLQLRHFGYVTQSFEDPARLAAAFRSRPPAALVADVVLPEGPLAGTTIASELCADRPGVPVVFISVRDDWNAQIAAVRAGGRAYLPKPIDFGALVDQLDRLTGRRDESPLRVLVVEDDSLLAERYAAVLRRAGMVVETPADPACVIERLSTFDPDLLLLDIYLPGCSGVELAQIVRQRPFAALLPIVFLSTERSREEQLHALRNGGDDFLEKPIDDRHLAGVVEIRARRFRALASLSSRDGLTGLLNQLSFRRAVDRELSRVARDGSPVTLAMVDLDGFKGVNDTFGHLAGDRVLRSLGRLMAGRLRKVDLAARYGGEEFALLLPDTTIDEARTVLDGLRKAFASLQFAEAARTFRVTFSAGLASGSPDRDFDTLVAAADAALYAAKRQGRNRVCAH